jgi:hypothetical protein
LANLGVQLKTLLGEIIFSGLLILLLVICTMPFLLGFAAIYRSYPRDLFWLKRFRLKASLIPVGALILICSVYLVTLPSYTSTWEQTVTVTQKIGDKQESSFIEFASFDYLKEIEVKTGSQWETINIWKSFQTKDYPLEMGWIEDTVSYNLQEDGEENIWDLKALFEFGKQPFSVNLELECDKSFTVEESNVKYNQSKNNTVSVRWYSFPPTHLNPQLKLRIPKEGELKAEIRATFLETPLEIACKGKNKHFIQRAEISRQIELQSNSPNADKLEKTQADKSIGLLTP